MLPTAGFTSRAVMPRALTAATRAMQARFIAVSAEATPNPSAMIFTLEGGKPILGKGAKSMSFEKTQCGGSPLAASLFRIHGVDKVLLAARHATVTKSPETEWEMLKPNVELVISQFFDIPNVKPVAPDSIEYTQEGQDQHNDDVVKSIHEILEQRIKPFVERDGGDVEFIAFDSDTGVLQIRLVGSCAGCPKSSVTLKFGIQRMVCHYIPEVKNVINIEEPTEGEEEGVVNSVDPQASAEPKASPNPEASVNREASTEPEDSAKSQQA